VVLPALLLILRPQLLGQDTSEMVIRFVPSWRNSCGAPPPLPSLPTALGEQHP
jgi:hypothetical protein